MYVYRSNRLEVLSDALADVLRQPSGGPTRPEVVGVLSQGMERWLAMRLAQRLGICANVSFLFPAKLVLDAFAAALGDDGRRAADWSVERLRWHVLAALPDLLGDPRFAPLRRYLRAEDGGPRALDRRDLQLAARIADGFDRYLTYRPEMILAWEAGGDDHADPPDDWQPVLWRALRQRIDGPHLAQLHARFAEAMHGTPDLGDFPGRVSVFGVGALPPFYVDVLSRLARHREVHLFVSCPSPLYWGHVRSKREQARELGRHVSSPAEALHLEEGHPLLASLGRLGRDFQIVLETTAAEPYVEPLGELFEAPAERRLLGRLQGDIFHLRAPSAPRAGEPPPPVDPADPSMTFHACHGPLRQVEVLRDELLRAFDELPGLEPRDVVVMTPDVETYAPLVEAVFGASADGAGGLPRLPYRVADRSLKRDNGVADALTRVLALAASRLTAPEVLDLLGFAPVRARFGLAPEDVAELSALTRAAGIRWGRDADDRARHGQPADSGNTWRFGLDRLLVGHAMVADGLPLFAGVLPHDELEGEAARRMGRFVDLCERLFAELADLADPRPMVEWRARLSETLDRLTLVPDAEAWKAVEVRGALAALEDAQSAAGDGSPVTLDALRALLEGQLGATGAGRGFLTGGITFCAMVPMRSIPFRVVALLGMDDGSFPRPTRHLGFDLMGKPGARRLGDRSPREDDRMLFLEALLAARERLIVTWTGRSLRDNKPLPPAVVVDELLDALGQREQRITEHPLQPFSPRAFGVAADGSGCEPRSYDGRWLAAARALQGPKQPLRRFLEGAGAVIPGAGPQADVRVDLGELLAFFSDPIKAFCRVRLGLDLREQEASRPDREPLELGGLERWSVDDDLLTWHREGISDDRALAALRASGRLPLGTPGQMAAGEALTRRSAVARALDDLEVGQPLPPLDVDLDLLMPDGTSAKLIGSLGDLWPSGLVRVRAGKGKARFHFDLWIRHLALQAASPIGGRRSHLVTQAPKGPGAERLVIEPVNDARELLGQLVHLHRLGLEAPLPLFPETSLAWAQAFGKAVAEGADEPEAVIAAEKAAGNRWRPWNHPGEGQAAEVERLYGEDCPVPWDEDFPTTPGVPGFGELARAVFLPFVAAATCEVIP